MGLVGVGGKSENTGGGFEQGSILKSMRNSSSSFQVLVEGIPGALCGPEALLASSTST